MNDHTEEKYLVLEELFYQYVISQCQSNGISPIVSALILGNVSNRLTKEAFTKSLLSRVVQPGEPQSNEQEET